MVWDYLIECVVKDVVVMVVYDFMVEFLFVKYFDEDRLVVVIVVFC